MSGATKFSIVLHVWLCIALVLTVSGKVTHESIWWWVIVAPPVATYALILYGGLAVSVVGLFFALLALLSKLSKW
ncbi:MAG: hypothetical protein RBS28_12470 [Rhodocyclaceae bacterium]|nr:hypothetical protein [Rhodocyclaceae bacterium]